MKRTVITLAALVALSATPALAASIDEVAPDVASTFNLVAASQHELKGYGTLVNSETEGVGAPAVNGPVRIVAYPDSERPSTLGQ
jgi:hypothetical protein